jgi:16S rRNA (guanine966-N2)-methyltransferase
VVRKRGVRAVRITGGGARGRRLKSVKGEATRPPLARVRQALFNILQPVTVGAVWLDLFAGTGSYGIEAISRGAREVVMIERSPEALAVIYRNLQVLPPEMVERATVVRGDVLHQIPRLARESRRFNIIGVAPPYFRELGPRVLDLLTSSGILADDGYVYVQRHRTEELPARTSTLVLARDYGYGDTRLSLYRPV